MFGGNFKLILSFSTLFLFINVFWQSSIVDASPIFATGDKNDRVNSNDDSQLGSDHQNLQNPRKPDDLIQNRIKRFRMLDQDEFQEMLKSLSHQTGDEQSKASNGMDTIGGMQLANYWAAA